MIISPTLTKITVTDQEWNELASPNIMLAVGKILEKLEICSFSECKIDWLPGLCIWQIEIVGDSRTETIQVSVIK